MQLIKKKAVVILSSKLSQEDINLLKKYYTSGEDKLDKSEQGKLTYAKAKPVSANDVLSLMDIKFPNPSDDEMDFVKQFVANVGMMKLTPEQVTLLNETANKSASIQDVVGIVMETYRNEIAKRYSALVEENLNLKIFLRDQLASQTQVKKLATKLHNAGELSDAAYEIIKKFSLKPSKSDYRTAMKTTEEALNNVVDNLNEQTEALDKVVKAQGKEPKMNLETK